MWKKLGLIYCPNGDIPWAQHYAMLPTVEIIHSDVLRVYYATLDKDRYGRIGYIDVNAANPKEILAVSKEPILDLGEIGSFDDSGVNPSCILTINQKKYLYYIGWQRCSRVPYMLFAGLATSDDGIHFHKYSRVPILDRTEEEPFIRSATSILYEDQIYKAWYVSAIKWIEVKGTLYPTYIIRYAWSKDGLKWSSNGPICIDFEADHEFGFGRPWVIKDGSTYKMWYSIRSKINPYAIGYAESKDGINWSRKDKEVGIERSKDGFDSEMICYPCVIDVLGKRYMFYNGNQHGSTGFGYAEFEN
jgi:predicted GH43/DUF377 family glycosyl hydrolase